MREINLQEIRLLLKLQGITVDFTDEELTLLINSKIRELEGLTGMHITPVDKTYYSRHLNQPVCELADYPILNVYKVFLDNVELKHKEYHVDYDLGIVYLADRNEGHHHFFHDYKSNNPYQYYPHRHHHHLYDKQIKVLYTTGVSDVDFTNLILPLLIDMVGYTINYAKVMDATGGMNRFLSSMKEGDVSLSFGKSNPSGVGDYGYDGSINSKIDDLRKRYMYSAKARLF